MKRIVFFIATFGLIGAAVEDLSNLKLRLTHLEARSVKEMEPSAHGKWLRSHEFDDVLIDSDGHRVQLRVSPYKDKPFAGLHALKNALILRRLVKDGSSARGMLGNDKLAKDLFAPTTGRWNRMIQKKDGELTTQSIQDIIKSEKDTLLGGIELPRILFFDVTNKRGVRSIADEQDYKVLINKLKNPLSSFLEVVILKVSFAFGGEEKLPSYIAFVIHKDRGNLQIIMADATPGRGWVADRLVKDFLGQK